MDKANWSGVWIDARTPPKTTLGADGVVAVSDRVLGWLGCMRVVEYTVVEGQGEWFITGNYEYAVTDDMQYWMPLPEPPKEM